MALILSSFVSHGANAHAKSYENQFETLMLTGTYQDFKDYYDELLKQPVPKNEPDKSYRYATLTRLCARLGLREESRRYLSKIDLNKTAAAPDRKLIINAYCEEMIQRINGIEYVDVNKMFNNPMKIYGNDIVLKVDFLRLLAYLSHFVNGHADAIGTYESAAKLIRNGDISPLLETEILLDLADTYIDAGQYEKATEMLSNAKAATEKFCSEKSILHARLSYIRGRLSASLNEHDKAEEHYLYAKHRMESNGEQRNSLYPAILKNIGIIAMNSGNYSMALEYFDCYTTSAASIFGKNSMAWYDASVYRLDAIFASGNIEQYEKEHDKIENFPKNIDLKMTPMAMMPINHSYKTYSEYIIRRGMPNIAVLMLQLMLDVTKQIDAENEIEIRNAYNMLGYTYISADNHTEASKCFAAQLEIDRKYAHDVFMFLPEAQRSAYWGKLEPMMNRLFNLNREGSVTLSDGTVTEIKAELPHSVTGSLLYDASLLNKGLMLEASVNLHRLLRDSNNPELLMLNDSLSQLRRKQASKGSLTHIESAAAISLEEKIMKESRQYGDFMNFANIRWQDVQGKLKNNEVAVEFVMSRDGNIEYYSAEILRKSFNEPKHVFLFALRKGDKRFEGADIYDSNTIHSKVWKKILAHVNKGETIYFSPAGKLYNLAIEHAMVNDGKRMNMSYNPVRLSSTRELVMDRPSNTNRNAVLYGGLNYDTDIEDMQLMAQTVSHTRGISRSLASDIENRDAWGYLPGTLTEVNSISHDISSGSNYKHILVTGDEGTEESFKSLSGQDNRILHIATHGFYLPPENSEEDFITANYAVDDNSLYRSALVLSGGNNGWLFPELIPEDLEDGMLTAKEISEMDLSNTDLVVMSACQTGLGDVTNEGVFGLQRAFKLAGAKTLVMSLSPVHDDATRVLMEEFYSSLFSGDSTRAAFAKAQNKVKNSKFNIDGKTLPGSLPQFWAPFVIMD
ncbi:MAG: CHAT domain-containing protein [Duncaniella sp.]|nr:CHAT domain-containing protein [Duncaniella sp.]